MRSSREIRFRLWQQSENLRLFAFPPRFTTQTRVADLPLPKGNVVAEALRTTPYAGKLQLLANEVVSHRFPLFGLNFETGPQVDWRKDYASEQTSGTEFFRFIPYLDFDKVGDHKQIWELNRHQHLVLLAQAWLCFDAPAYLTELQEQLESWFSQNPFLRGMNYTSALEVAFRALSWLWIDHLAGDALRPEVRNRLRNALLQHGYYLQANLSTYFSPNTHLLGEGVALHALGLKFPGTGWERLGDRLLAEERDRQIQADGSHFEQSTYYHVYALDFFLFYYLLAGRPASFEEPIRRMARFLASVQGPAGLLSFFGDDDGGRLFHPYGDRAAFGRASLSTCAQVLPGEDLPFDCEAAAEQAAWWVGPGFGRGVVEWPKAHRVDSRVRFADSGLISITRGALHILVDTGPFGPGGAGHSHSDTLSLAIRNGERELLIDPGTFTYATDPRVRDQFRGSGYHNTVRVDRLDQADPTRPFRWDNKPLVSCSQFREDSESVFIDAQCESRGITHRRRLFLADAAVLFVFDQITGPEAEHECEQVWHMPSQGAVRVLSDNPSEPEHIAGWRSRCLGSKEPSHLLVYCWRGRLPLARSTAVILDGSGLGQAQLQCRYAPDSVRIVVPGLAGVEFSQTGFAQAIAG